MTQAGKIITSRVNLGPASFESGTRSGGTEKDSGPFPECKTIGSGSRSCQEAVGRAVRQRDQE